MFIGFKVKIYIIVILIEWTERKVIMDLNPKAYSKMNYGMTIIGVGMEGQDQGCLVNSFQQVSSYPPKFTLTLSKTNQTCTALDSKGSFAATLVGKNADREILKEFGYESGRTVNKFAGKPFKKDSQKNPYLPEGMTAVICCRILNQVDLGKYILFVGEVQEAEVLEDGYPMTLEEYKEEGNTTPPRATVYRTLNEDFGFHCTVCGYIYEKEELPEEYHCPVCRAPASKFEKI